jgi:preprotein translocase subunit SecG
MYALTVAIHVVTCLLLIAVVLLQHGKGADIGVQFGGGSSQTVFGARGAGNFLTKATTGAAIVFMITSLVLSRMSGDSVDRILEAPAPEPAAQSPALPPEHPAGSAAPAEGLSEFEVIEPTTPASPAPSGAAPQGESPSSAAPSSAAPAPTSPAPSTAAPSAPTPAPPGS